ncbi:MAG TPA: response regulator [Gemmataceae bacterium]|nr:response regulator [Gemmataceae bacterium]
MHKVLIVDDSMVDRRLAGRLVEMGVPGGNDLIPIYASNGREALEAIEKENPDAVLTDLQMPEMNGLELVQEVRNRFPLVPVILMTAHGSEELAVKALKSGAASYVPKRELAKDLIETLTSVIESAHGQRDHRRLLRTLQSTESYFVLDNDPALIPPLISFLKDNVTRLNGDEPGMIQTTVALREAILNAMDHGNLELDSALRERDDNAYHDLQRDRRHQKPYMDRRVHLTAREAPGEATYIIRDEGPGFDVSKLPDPTDPVNLERRSGRGLLLIRAFMTEVRHNERGNELTLIRRTP